MIESEIMSPLDHLRYRERTLELEAYAIAAQIREVRAAIALLEARQPAQPRRGRPPRLSMHIGGAAARPGSGPDDGDAA